MKQIFNTSGPIVTSQLRDELIAAKVQEPLVVGYSSRRPNTVTLEGDIYQHTETIKSIIAAHAPDYGNIARKVAEIKAEASKRILDIAPIWKQVNMLVFAADMSGKKLGNNSLTKEEQDKLDGMEVLWDTIKKLRSASDTIEAEIADLTDEEAGKYDVVDNLKWGEQAHEQITK